MAAFYSESGAASGGLVVRILALSLPGPAFHPASRVVEELGGGRGEHLTALLVFIFSSFSFHINNKLFNICTETQYFHFFSSVNDV